MAVYLIRHAHAGTRGAFDGPDGERPLSRRGVDQAEGIGDLLATAGVRRVLSSPARRCVQTVEPLARKADVDVEARRELAEGADATAVVDLLLRHARKHVAVCVHGDVIPGVLRLLMTEHGTRVKGREANQKGSVWEIDVEDGRPTRARYHAPTA